MNLVFRTVLSLLLVLGCFSCKNTSGSELLPESQKPSVILILTDDQGWGDLSFNGNTNLNTPNIDAIARNGISFDNFYVQPVCSPTRAELLTGRHFARMGVYSTSAGGERFNLGETTIAEIFKKAGYQTAAYGKWHNGMQPPYHPNARGFDDYYGFASGHWGNYFNPMLEHNGQIVKGNGFIIDDLTDRGLDFINKYQEESFFLYLPFNTPHSPMQVPDKFWNRFANKKLAMKHRDSTLENENFTKAALAMVENIDYNIGRVTSKLQELDLEENTIVIYLSDNGPNSWRWNGGMRGRKGATDEGGVRSPFFIQWRDSLPSGKRVEEIASAIDVLPTLASLVGIPLETNKPIDGKDLGPLLFEKNEAWSNRMVYNHWNGKTSIRSQGYRLDHENRLYNMTRDRAQLEDISRAQPILLDSLIRIREKWLSEMGLDNLKGKSRPFPLGHPDFKYTQLPARDGVPHGTIKRSNKYPNDSFFSNWTSPKDSISWNVEVLAAGDYEVTLYYSCAPENVGTSIQLSLGNKRITKKITEAHDPPLTGMEDDRIPRIESYVKDFRPVILGTLSLDKGKGNLIMKAEKIPGRQAIDVRLLHFRKIP